MFRLFQQNRPRRTMVLGLETLDRRDVPAVFSFASTAALQFTGNTPGIFRRRGELPDVNGGINPLLIPGSGLVRHMPTYVTAAPGGTANHSTPYHAFSFANPYAANAASNGTTASGTNFFQNHFNYGTFAGGFGLLQ